jgi:hypothetical protein
MSAVMMPRAPNVSVGAIAGVARTVDQQQRVAADPIGVGAHLALELRRPASSSPSR